MLTEEQIRQALHAGRVVPVAVDNPHGPLGLEQLAAAVARIAGWSLQAPQADRIRRPIALSVQAWNKLDQLAQATTQATAHPVSPSEVASVIIEQFVATEAEPRQ